LLAPLPRPLQQHDACPRPRREDGRHQPRRPAADHDDARRPPGIGSRRHPAIMPVTPARIIATAMAARNRLATFATAFDVLGPKNRSSPGPNVNATNTRSMLTTMLTS